MPVGAAVIISTFLVWERKARRAGLIPHKKWDWSKTHEAVWDFMSAIDLGGIVLLCGGCSSVLSLLRPQCISRLTSPFVFSFILVSCSLAGTVNQGWANPGTLDSSFKFANVSSLILNVLRSHHRFSGSRPRLPGESQLRSSDAQALP